MSTKTTMHLGRAASWLDRWQIPPALLVAALIFLVAAGISGVSRLRSAPSAAAVPTPALPIIIIASPLPHIPPTAVPPLAVSYQQPPRYVVAWSAPDGDVLGPIPAPATSALLGRWGDGWVATIWEQNTVWIRAADLNLNLANLAPQIAPAPAGPRVVTVEQRGAPQPAEQPYQTDNQPPAPTQPAQRAVAPAVEIAPPATLVPMAQNDVTQEWARQQYLAEHPEANR